MHFLSCVTPCVTYHRLLCVSRYTLSASAPVFGSCGNGVSERPGVVVSMGVCVTAGVNVLVNVGVCVSVAVLVGKTVCVGVVGVTLTCVIVGGIAVKVRVCSVVGVCVLVRVGVNVGKGRTIEHPCTTAQNKTHRQTKVIVFILIFLVLGVLVLVYRRF